MVSGVAGSVSCAHIMPLSAQVPGHAVSPRPLPLTQDFLSARVRTLCPGGGMGSQLTVAELLRDCNRKAKYLLDVV